MDYKYGLYSAKPPHKDVLDVSSLSTRKGNYGSSNVLRRQSRLKKSESLLQESHLNWPSPLLTK
jgi:hypothetical protein